MDVKTLYTLVAIADRGSFAEASKVLNVSLSAVSMQMRSLEEELGTKLFDRSRRPAALTESGLYLIERARVLISQWEELSESLKREATGAILKIGVVHTAVSGIVPPALSLLQKKAPGIEIRLTMGLTHDLETAVYRGELDAAVVTEPQITRSELEFHAIIDEPLMVIAQSSMTGDSDQKLLESQPYVRFNRTAHVGQMIQAEFDRRGIKVQSVMEIDSLEGAIAMVANGLGVSVVPARGMSNEFPNSIRMIPFGNPPMVRRLGLLLARGNPRKRASRALLEALTEIAENYKTVL